MMDRGVIAADTFSSSSGQAGDIDVQVRRLMLSEGAQISSSSFGVGRGGNVSVAATEAIRIASESVITSSTGLLSSGTAGDVIIKTGELI